MYILFHFWTGIKSLSSDFQYSRCFDKHEMNGTFQVKVAEIFFLRYLLHAEQTDSYHLMV